MCQNGRQQCWESAELCHDTASKRYPNILFLLISFHSKVLRSSQTQGHRYCGVSRHLFLLIWFHSSRWNLSKRARHRFVKLASWMRSRFTTKRSGGNVPPAPGKEEYSRSFSEGDRTVFEDDAEDYFWDRDSFEDVPLWLSRSARCALWVWRYWGTFGGRHYVRCVWFVWRKKILLRGFSDFSCFFIWGLNISSCERETRKSNGVN